MNHGVCHRSIGVCSCRMRSPRCIPWRPTPRGRPGRPCSTDQVVPASGPSVSLITCKPRDHIHFCKGSLLVDGPVVSSMARSEFFVLLMF